MSCFFYVVLPHGAGPERREMEFTARLGKGDVFSLVDTTGSMATAINNVRSSLSSVIVPRVADAIADVVMGGGDFRDFPVSPYGDTGDWAFRLRQSMTAEVGAVQCALDGLRAGGGGEVSESIVDGIMDLVGAATQDVTCRRSSVPRSRATTCREAPVWICARSTLWFRASMAASSEGAVAAHSTPRHRN